MTVPAGSLPAERSEFLAAAGRTLAGSLNLDRTMTRSVHLLVPRFGRWCEMVVTTSRGLRVARLSGSTSPLVYSEGAAPLADLPAPLRAAMEGEVPLSAPIATEAELARWRVPGPRSAALSLPAELEIHPLRARGMVFGTLLLAGGGHGGDPEEADTVLLEELLERIGLAVDAARLYGERTHVAEVLQASLRPPVLPAVPGVRLAARYRAALEHSEIGGDFYDVHGSDGDWSVVMGDVCGKGVEAAVLTGQARQTIRTAAAVNRSPAAILQLLNTVLSDRDVSSGVASFVTVACARLQVGSAAGSPRVRLRLASGGHLPPLLIRAGGQVEPVATEGLLVGIFPETNYDEVELALEPGDTCLLYTDGVVEARGHDGEFGTERLMQLTSECAGADPDVLVDVVLQAVIEHLRGRPHDDVALLAVQAAASEAP